MFYFQSLFVHYINLKLVHMKVILSCPFLNIREQWMSNFLMPAQLWALNGTDRGNTHGLVRRGLVYEQPPAMSRSPQSKMARWPKQINEAGKCIRENTAFWTILNRWRLCSGMPRGCVNRIRLWPLKRNDHSGVLIGTGGTRRSDWPAGV